MIHIEIRNVELCGTVCPMVRQTQCHIERCVECPNLIYLILTWTKQGNHPSSVKFKNSKNILRDESAKTYELVGRLVHLCTGTSQNTWIKAPAHRSCDCCRFCCLCSGKKALHIKAFTQRFFLHRAAFTHRNFHTQTRLHRDVFT